MFAKQFFLLFTLILGMANARTYTTYTRGLDEEEETTRKMGTMKQMAKMVMMDMMVTKEKMAVKVKMPAKEKKPVKDKMPVKEKMSAKPKMAAMAMVGERRRASVRLGNRR